jgi:tRNA(His) 5'-end guanylyltransferase
MNSTLNPTAHTLLRLDGRRFSRFTKACKLNKPFDEDFTQAMKETAMECFLKMEFFEFGFVGSDEITFYLAPIKEENSILPFGGRQDKLISILSGIVSTTFYKKLSARIGHEKLETLVPHFDCRVWQVDHFSDVVSNIKERILYTLKNSRMMFAQHHLSVKCLHSVSSRDAIQKVLEQTGREYYDDVHVDNRIGSVIVKVGRDVEKEVVIKGETKRLQFHRYAPEFRNIGPMQVESVLNLYPSQTLPAQNTSEDDSQLSQLACEEQAV